MQVVEFVFSMWLGHNRANPTQGAQGLRAASEGGMKTHAGIFHKYLQHPKVGTAISLNPFSYMKMEYNVLLFLRAPIEKTKNEPL